MDEHLIQEINLMHERVCRGFADAKRVMILYSLNERARYVSELAEELDMPQPTVSRHLKILRDCGLVQTTRKGAAVYYEISDHRAIEALDLLRSILHDGIMEQAKLFQNEDKN